ncbi:hypothetical protein [Apilactobacillus xinyiensis]|uniref:hypothetical protein n=1 Tax=Apilactobacillus xinyiensis TaxID=2841032 RepID=UPI00200FDFFA|nr:hypothetical protein [Apilactobacillus xinyiensis]MCL0330671.1 hypothetical protein [Apilactobacillus xinyiensis]
MVSKKPSILQRKVNGAIKPKEQYHEEINNSESEKQKSKVAKKGPRNQKKSIKISEDAYKDLSVLKNMQHVKFDYEIIQLLFDKFYDDMTEEEKRRFTVIRENI